MEEIKYKPIGMFRGAQKTPGEAPRQASLSTQSHGVVELASEISPTCLSDLENFTHIWLLYAFHRNSQWSPQVRPPRGGKKRGVFATRSPYRPSPIGMSCVLLGRIEGSKLFVKNIDLLDETPILDIKPYLSYADSFPEASLGWIEGCKKFEIKHLQNFEIKLRWLDSRLDVSLRTILENQLMYEPLNNKIKRVKPRKEGGFVFAYKTWRFYFTLEAEQVKLFDIASGYSFEEAQDSSDPYNDKALHKEFLDQFH